VPACARDGKLHLERVVTSCAFVMVLLVDGGGTTRSGAALGAARAAFCAAFFFSYQRLVEARLASRLASSSRCCAAVTRSRGVSVFGRARPAAVFFFTAALDIFEHFLIFV